MAARQGFTWELGRGRTLQLGTRMLVMGILNVTPDSFSDGGLYQSAEKAVTQAERMLAEGADLLDLGAESTRPGAEPVVDKVERERLLPVLHAVRQACPEAVLSVDTYHAETARAALDCGADVINDVSGLRWDAAMAAVLADAGCGCVLMHTRGTPATWRAMPAIAPGRVVPLVIAGLQETLRAAEAAGIAREAMVLDPGFGFGKMGAANWELLAGLGEFGTLERPLLIGLSRKGFLGGAVGSEERAVATDAAHLAAVLGGAAVLRVHDVGRAKVVGRVGDALLAGGEFPVRLEAIR